MSGSGREVFNPFNIDPNTNPTRPDLTYLTALTKSIWWWNPRMGTSKSI